MESVRDTLLSWAAIYCCPTKMFHPTLLEGYHHSNKTSNWSNGINFFSTLIYVNQAVFVTRLTREVVATPLWTWKINAWGMLIWYHCIAMGLLFPYIPQKVIITHVWHHNDVIIDDFAQFGDFQWNIGQSLIFCQKSFLLVKERNDVSNIYCKIQDHKLGGYFSK